MARKYAWLVIVGLLALGVLVAARVLRTRGGALPRGQGSPQAVLRKLQEALARGKKAEFADCFATPSAEHRAAVEELYEAIQAAYALRAALRSHQGKNAFDEFMDALVGPAEVKAFVWPPETDVTASRLIVSTGGNATVELPELPKPLRLKLAGVWRIELLADATAARLLRDILARTAAALRKASQAAGLPPEALARKVQEELREDQ